MSTTSTRLHGDTRRLVVFVTVLVAVLGIVSFTAGVPGLMAVGAWALLPGWMSALVPVIVDGGILVFSLVAVVRRARGEGAVFAWSCLAILTLGSVAAQVAHVLLGSGSVAATAIAGAVVAGAFPSVVFASTHAILDLAIAPAPKRGKHAEDAPEQPAEARAVILRETPITRPAVNTEQPARRVERDAERVLPELAEQPAKVTVTVPVADAEQVPATVAREVPEQVERDVPEAVEQPARPVPEAPARPTPNTPAKKAPSTRPSASSAAGERAREQAVNAVLAGMPKAAAAREFGVARATLQRAVAAAEAEREQVVAA